MEYRVTIATGERLFVEENGHNSIFFTCLFPQAESSMSLSQTTPRRQRGRKRGCASINQSIVLVQTYIDSVPNAVQ